MTIHHRPSEETLFAYAAGNLARAEALVVATHLSLCGESQQVVAEFERIGGLLLQELPPTPLSADALSRALARTELPTGREHLTAQEACAEDFPEPLRGCELGPWQWAGLGTRVRRVGTAAEGESRAIMFRIDPGRKMPQHTHAGREFTCVISGSYTDESGRYGPGDFEEADEEVSHRPIVDSDVPCLCIVALTGAIRLEGAIGRLFQPFVRI